MSIQNQQNLISSVKSTTSHATTLIHDNTISFLMSSFDTCGIKMIQEYVPLFEKEGYQLTVTLTKGAFDILELAPRIVVLFRLGSSLNTSDIEYENIMTLIQRLKHFGARIVYYLDDLLLYFNQAWPLRFMKICHSIIVATEEIQNEIRNNIEFPSDIIIVPTHVDLKYFDNVQPVPHIAKIPRFKVLLSSSGRIGATWLFQICEIANTMPEFNDVQWIIQSISVAQFRTLINSFRNLHKLYIDALPYNQYHTLVKASNLIINPASTNDLAYFLPDKYHNSWLRAKSPLKYVYAGAARIPIISSPATYEYVKAIKDGETGFIANTPQEFIDKILLLKNDKDLYTRIGLNARRDIEENFDINIRYPLYRNALLGRPLC